MNLGELKEGTRLELEIPSKDEKGTHVYVSQLLESIKDNRFIIAAPIFEARLIYIPADARVKLIFNHYPQGLIGFMSIVRSKEMRGNIAIMNMEVAGPIDKVQRRTYYRLDCIIDAEYRQHAEIPGDAGVKAVSLYKKAIVKNISGSGACIVTEERLTVNTECDVTIHLDTGSIDTLCSVIRCTEIEVKKGRKYHIGMCYKEINPKDMDTIIRYVFTQQRLLFKKETT